MNTEKIIEEIFKSAVDISEVDPKISNRIAKIKEIYQDINKIQKIIDNQVKTMTEEIKDLKKQASTFEREILPTLQQIEDHAIKAEGIVIELKKGRRSPKIGYDYLASRVNSDLLKAAEEAMSAASQFAKSPSITVSHVKTAGILNWLKQRWNDLISWVKKLKTREKSLSQSVKELDQLTK